MDTRPREYTDLTTRPTSEAREVQLFCGLPYVLNEEVADDLYAGRRRPEWLWMALRGDRLLARAGWWGQPDEATPSVLDILDLDDDPNAVDITARLLTIAMSEILPPETPAPEYVRFVPSDWRDQPSTARGIEARMEALERTGAHLLVERLRFEWRSGTPVAAPTGRLSFQGVSDNAQLLDLMTAALEGTLDAQSRLDLARGSARAAAVSHFEGELARYASPRDWWRLATLPDREPVGFVIPARNDYHSIIAYLAVLPKHRGNGYVSDVLAEGTRILEGQQVPRIRASTDIQNVPMARAFLQAGWLNFERTIKMTW